MSDLLTLSVAEAARQICGDELKDPERWLMRQIRTGRVRATHIGRTYRMTPQQVQDAIKALETAPPPPVAAPAPDIAPYDCVSPGSRRSRRRA